jgi:uncharacterized membrane protein YcaP (DUF421 family)
LWHNIWDMYVKDWTAHTTEQHVIQILSVLVILLFGMTAIRVLGKKSISQMTLTDTLFLFVLSSTLGALITKPVRVFVAMLVVLTIVTFVLILEKLALKVDKIERLLLSQPEILYKEGNINEKALKKNNMTVDTLESTLRQKGVPAMEVCKMIVLEPTGIVSVEFYPEYEPVKKIYFDAAIEEIMKALKIKDYKEPELPDMNSNFDEVEIGTKAHKNKVPKRLE